MSYTGTSMEIHPEAASNFDRLGLDLMGRLKRGVGTKRPTGEFKPDIHPAFTFSADDLLGPVRWTSAVVNGEGEEVGRVIEDLQLAVVGPNYEFLKSIVASMQRSSSIAAVASTKYLLDCIWKWVEDSARNGVRKGLAAHVLDRLDQDVSEQEIWFPLYRVFSEIDLKIGSVAFKTLDTETMQRWQDCALAIARDDEKQAANNYYHRFRSDMQGSIAAAVRVTAEPLKAHEDGRQQAKMAVSLLRFISIANLSPRTRSYCALLGEEQISKTCALTVENGNLKKIERGTQEKIPDAWIIRKEDIADLPPMLLSWLDALSLNHESGFAKRLYDSLLIYSQNSVSRDTSDRLLFILVALESMLLRDESEPIQKNLGERLALIAGKTVEERKSIVANVADVYRIRSKFVHHGQSAEDFEPLYPFMSSVWVCFCKLLEWQTQFKTKADLISWLESRKLSG